MVPWHSGHSATWDVTVVHTLAASYVTQSAVQAGRAAKIAAERKSAKYSGLGMDGYPPGHADPAGFPLTGEISLRPDCMWNGGSDFHELQYPVLH